MSDIKFYMQKCTKQGVLIGGTKKDLENDFVNLRYMEAKGIERIGKAKNIYTEQYADSETLRTWHPSENGEETTHEATVVELKLLFYGEHRRESYDEFNKYIRDGYLMYWDTLRGKKFMFMVIDSIDPSDDNFKGGTPYITCVWKLQNLKGYTEKV